MARPQIVLDGSADDLNRIRRNWQRMLDAGIGMCTALDEPSGLVASNLASNGAGGLKAKLKPAGGLDVDVDGLFVTGGGGVSLATEQECHEGVVTTKAVFPEGLLFLTPPVGSYSTFGTAIVAGDLTLSNVGGNARGDYSIDIQSLRTVAANAATGDFSICIGMDSKAAGSDMVVIGEACSGSGQNSVIIGDGADGSTHHDSIVIGTGASSSGIFGIAIGANSVAGEEAVSIGDTAGSGTNGIAIGYTADASGTDNIGIGHSADNDPTAQKCTVIGYGAISSGAVQKASAIGYSACCRITNTTNIGGPIIVRKDNGEGAGAEFQAYSGADVILLSTEVSLKSLATQTITLPSGCKFFINEIGVIATSVVGLTAQPFVSFGIAANHTKQRASTQTTKLTAAGKREAASPLVPEDGETTLTATVATAATGTTILGRFYWRGMLIEDE